MAVTLTTDEEIAAPAMGSGSSPKMAAPRGRNFEEAFTGKAAGLVKGVGHVTSGIPLNDTDHGAQIFTRSHDLITRTKAATLQGSRDSESVLGGFSQDFLGNPRFAGFAYQLAQDAQVRKAFTATNTGAAGVPYGLVPFDLLAPSRLISD